MINYKEQARYWQKKDKEFQQMDSNELKKEIESFISEHTTCALATGYGSFVRCTPLEYMYVNECFYFFSEGGLKFLGLEKNENVCLSIYNEYKKAPLAGLQVDGLATIIEEEEEYKKLVEWKKIPWDKFPKEMPLIKVEPTCFTFVNHELSQKGYGPRQVLEVKKQETLIDGIHHVCLKCPDQTSFDKTVHFYTDILECPIVRTWPNGILIKLGTSGMEIFLADVEELPQGTIRHFALETKHVDEIVEKVRKAGYEITVEPKDVTLASNPPFPIHIAFCIGPAGEEIELFQEK